MSNKLKTKEYIRLVNFEDPDTDTDTDEDEVDDEGTENEDDNADKDLLAFRKSLAKEAEGVAKSFVKEMKEVATKHETALKDTIDGGKKDFVREMKHYKESEEEREHKQMEYQAKALRAIAEGNTKEVGLKNAGIASEPNAYNLAASDAANTETDAEGGFAVRDTFSTQVLRPIVKESQLAKYLRTISLPNYSRPQKIPSISNVITYWVEEGETIKSARPTLGQRTLVMHKIATIVPVSMELLTGTYIDLVTHIRSLVAEDMAEKMQHFVFNGVGTGGGKDSPSNGLLKDTSIPTIDINRSSASHADTALSEQNVRAIVNSPTNAKAVRSQSQMLIEQDEFDKMAIARASGGVKIYPSFDTSTPRALGRPVDVLDEADKSANNAIIGIYGALRRSVIVGIGNSVAVTRATEGTVKSAAGGASDVNLLTDDMVAFRFITFCGYVRTDGATSTDLRRIQTKVA